jgi:uncharacterized protein YuzE
MKIEYDPQADALYIQLRKGKIAQTVETSHYIYADVDEEGQPLGLEILFVKRHLKPEDLTSITFNILSAAQPTASAMREGQARYTTQTGLKYAFPVARVANGETASLVILLKQVALDDFVKFWEPRFSGREDLEDWYRENIIEVENLKEENLKALFEWKLDRKIERVARNYRRAFEKARMKIGELNKFKHHSLTEEDFLHFLSNEITNGPIYQPFFFHICRPLEFALYDQHVYRAWQFLVHWEIKEVPNDFKAYKQYNEFFSKQAQVLATSLNDRWIARRKLDKALMAFGQFIKRNAEVLQSKEIGP